MRSLDPLEDDQLNEYTVTHSDVFESSHDGTKPIGKLTPAGEALKLQNPALLSCLVQEGLEAAHRRAPMLFGSTTADWQETNTFRRHRTIPFQPAVATSAPSQPAALTPEALAKLFGRTSDASAVNRLSRENPAEYQRLRAAAVEAGLVRPTPTQEYEAHRRKLGFA